MQEAEEEAKKKKQELEHLREVAQTKQLPSLPSPAADVVCFICCTFQNKLQKCLQWQKQVRFRCHLNDTRIVQVAKPPTIEDLHDRIIKKFALEQLVSLTIRYTKDEGENVMIIDQHDLEVALQLNTKELFLEVS